MSDYFLCMVQYSFFSLIFVRNDFESCVVHFKLKIIINLLFLGPSQRAEDGFFRLS